MSPEKKAPVQIYFTAREKLQVADAAKQDNRSMASYILTAVKEKMAKEKQNAND